MKPWCCQGCLGAHAHTVVASMVWLHPGSLGAGGPAAGLNFYPALAVYTPVITSRELTY